MKPPARKLVQCTNEECPEVASTGAPWKGQRKSHRATEEPCPRCSSAVVVVMDGARLDPIVTPLAEAMERATVEVDEFVRDRALPEAPPRPLRPPYIGRPTVTCHDPVRYGLAAHQRLEALARRKEHRGKTRAELVGWALDQWGAGLSDAPGAA